MIEEAHLLMEFPAAQGWEPENPFLIDGASQRPARESPISPAEVFGARYQSESPFVAEYEGEDATYNPARAALYASLISELHDQEFEEAVDDLVNEASSVVEDRFSNEAGEATDRSEVERAVRSYLRPLAYSAEAALDQMMTEFGQRDLTQLTESEVDQLLDGFRAAPTQLTPAFDQFLGKLIKKAKGAIKAGVRIAKKAASAVASVMPINLILGRLRVLVRPLLERVLRFAIDRLPVALRPVAGQLAQRFLGINVRFAQPAAVIQPPPVTQGGGDMGVADASAVQGAASAVGNTVAQGAAAAAGAAQGAAAAAQDAMGQGAAAAQDATAAQGAAAAQGTAAAQGAAQGAPDAAQSAGAAAAQGVAGTAAAGAAAQGAAAVQDPCGGAANTEMATADTAEIQQEMDAKLAGYLVDGESFESEAALEESLADQWLPIGYPLRDLARARRRFARRLIRLREGESPQPAVEEFVPAVLAALKLGMRIIGRPRVVRFLSGLVANLIRRYVGPQQAGALSTALVDAGLRVVNLEAEEEAEPMSAGYTLASTVEDTVTRLLEAAPAEAWESEALLAAHANGAFQEAASANFPDSMIRQELHEAARVRGAWIALPARSPHKRYKKYSRVLKIMLTPQKAAAIRTFGGISLRAFLRDRLGLQVDGPVRMRMHLYEALPGTSLGLIAHHERNVAGLGSSRRSARSLFHPLTPLAAGIMLGEPRLGRSIGARFLARRRRIGVGQRFYFLEIAGARVRVAPTGPRAAGQPAQSGRPARSSQLNAIFDFPGRQLRLAVYYSEADAQRLAVLMRKRTPVPGLLTVIKETHDASFKQAFAEGTNDVRIVHEGAPTQDQATPLINNVMRIAGPRLADKVRDWMLEAMKRELETGADRLAAEFEKVVADEADGVTMLWTFEAPPLLDQVKMLIAPPAGAAATAIADAIATQPLGPYKLQLRSGFADK